MFIVDAFLFVCFLLFERQIWHREIHLVLLSALNSLKNHVVGKLWKGNSIVRRKKPFSTKRGIALNLKQSKEDI